MNQLFNNISEHWRKTFVITVAGIPNASVTISLQNESGATVPITLGAGTHHIGALFRVRVIYTANPGWGISSFSGPSGHGSWWTVTDSASFSAVATLIPITPTWQRVWTGSHTFTSNGSFIVPGLNAGGNVQIVANATFSQTRYDESGGGDLGTETVFVSGNRVSLSTSIRTEYSAAEVFLSRNDNQIHFTFTDGKMWPHQFFRIEEVPLSLTITEVWRQG